MSQKMTPKQTKALAALLEERTLEGAAARAGINRRTLNRWMQEAEFRQALKQAEGELMGDLSRRLLALGSSAVDALADILETPAQPGASNKRMTASDLLAKLLDLREFADLEARITELEKQVGK